MELIKVPKVEHVGLLHNGRFFPGTLHVTPHHLIFKSRDDDEGGSPQPRTAPEMWITFPIIHTVDRRCIGNYLDGTAGTGSPGERRGLTVSREASNASDESTLSAAEAQKRLQALAVRLRCRDFTCITFCFDTEQEAKDIFDTIKKLTVSNTVDRLYAFKYKATKYELPFNGWTVYDPQREFDRQGITKDWRLSNINSNYNFCDTYPAQLYVPATISDNTLNYASRFRSRQRIPVLTYIHNVNNCTLTRCAQPMTGLQKNRSVQDEKLVQAIFESSNAAGYASLGISHPDASSSSQSFVKVDHASAVSGPKMVYGAQQTNLIIDARPGVNAYAQQAGGAGTEAMDNYKFAKREFLGIDNIHVMRNSLAKVVDAFKDSDITPLPPNRDLLTKSNWLRHIKALMEGTSLIVRQVAVKHSHVLIHCSDGWDRTAQFAALAQICLDPYFRTLEGFMVLVEKDWISFGHKFRDRCGFLGSEKWFTQPADNSGGAGGFESALGAAKMFFGQQASNLVGKDEDNSDPEGVDSPTPNRGRKQKDKGTDITETSPVFQQFLDVTYQLMLQHPTRFEFNERFLRRLLYHMHSCQYGTFLYNSEKDRVEAHAEQKTRSVWDYFLARRGEWMNSTYDPAADLDERGSRGRVIFPVTGAGKEAKWWAELFGRTTEEMNGRSSIFGRGGEPSPMKALDPVKDAGSAAVSEEDIAKSAAVLGTERAAALAEEAQQEAEDGKEAAKDGVDEIAELLVHVDVDGEGEELDPEEERSGCATAGSTSTLDMSESVQVTGYESDSRSRLSPSPPVISLDATPEKRGGTAAAAIAAAVTAADEPVVVEREQEHDAEEVVVNIDGEAGADADGDADGGAAVLVSGDPLGGHEAVDVTLSPSPRMAGRRYPRSRTPRRDKSADGE
ncbi:Myotubularin [Orbilia brochopaga]|nr:Myotubularin [Drechslerella brochopaga]